MDQELADRRHDVAVPCRRHRVARLDIFGSAARQSHGAADLDLLVEFEDLPADAYAASYLGLEDLEVGGLPAGADCARLSGRSTVPEFPGGFLDPLELPCAEKTTDSIQSDACFNVFTSSEAIPRKIVSYNLFSAEIELIVEVVCDQNGAALNLGFGLSNQYIFEKTYIFRKKKDFEAEQWEEVTLVGQKRGQWFIRRAGSNCKCQTTKLRVEDSSGRIAKIRLRLATSRSYVPNPVHIRRACSYRLYLDYGRRSQSPCRSRGDACRGDRRRIVGRAQCGPA